MAKAKSDAGRLAWTSAPPDAPGSFPLLLAQETGKMTAAHARAHRTENLHIVLIPDKTSTAPAGNAAVKASP